MAITLTASCEEVQIPADLVQQLFERQTPNQPIQKRPFDLEELQAVVGKYGNPSKVAVDLTHRYLKVSYPKEAIDVLQIVHSDLPEEVKLALVAAPAGSLRISLGANPRAWLGSIPQQFLQALFRAPAANMAHDSLQPLEISDLLALNSEHYSRAIFYSAQTPMHVDQGYYLVSYPRRETHLLDAYLEWGRARPRRVIFSSAQCQEERCITPSVGETFASFEFRGSDASYPRAGQRVEATCRYQAAYRRDYETRSEIEFAFEECTLETLDGKAPVRDPLLEDLRRVKNP